MYVLLIIDEAEVAILIRIISEKVNNTKILSLYLYYWQLCYL